MAERLYYHKKCKATHEVPIGKKCKKTETSIDDTQCDTRATLMDRMASALQDIEQNLDTLKRHKEESEALRDDADVPVNKSATASSLHRDKRLNERAAARMADLDSDGDTSTEETRHWTFWQELTSMGNLCGSCFNWTSAKLDSTEIAAVPCGRKNSISEARRESVSRRESVTAMLKDKSNPDVHGHTRPYRPRTRPKNN